MTSVSVIICTRNRAESLAGTLESVSRCELPLGWSGELLVVDNGSTDHTQRVLERAPRGLLGLRSVVEERAGLSNARNRGLRESAGRIIVFTDDDVRVASDWIESLCAPIVRGAADAVQGGVVPAPHLERVWLRGVYANALAIVRCDKTEPTHALIGANIAFSRSVLANVGGFEPTLGAGASGFGEDELFAAILVRSGYRIVRVANAEVEHHFDESRLCGEYFIRWAKQSGWSSGMVRCKHLGERFVFPALQAAWWRIKLRVRRVRNDESVPIPPEWRIWYLWYVAFFDAITEAQAKK